MISSIVDLPFAEREPWPLFGLDPRRTTPNRRHVEFGWCVLRDVVLEGRGGATHKNALVVAVHTRSRPRKLVDDVELEFIMRDEGGEYGVVTRWSDFAGKVVSPIVEVRRPPVVVLALCNKHRVELPQVPGWPTLVHALGDVTAWMTRRGAVWSQRTALVSLEASDWRPAR